MPLAPFINLSGSAPVARRMRRASFRLSASFPFSIAWTVEVETPISAANSRWEAADDRARTLRKGC
ncbi:MAG: hypothetical protein R3F11_28790 [Verrucomicrobiales bacterium]